MLPSFSLTLYHVKHRWQHQLPLKRKILVYCRSVANDSRFLGCNIAVIFSIVTSVSKYHTAFICKVWQYLNTKVFWSLETLGNTQPTTAEYPTSFKSSSKILVPLYQSYMASCSRNLYTGHSQWQETWISIMWIILFINSTSIN